MIGSSRLVLAVVCVVYVVYSGPFYIDFVSLIFPLVELSLLQQAITSSRGIQALDEGFVRGRLLTPRTAALALVNRVNERLPSVVHNWRLN